MENLLLKRWDGSTWIDCRVIQYYNGDFKSSPVKVFTASGWREVANAA